MEWLWHNFCNLWSWKDESHENVEPGTWCTELVHHSKWSRRDAPADEVGYAGLRLFCLLYGGTKTDTLPPLRYARYMTMMAKSNKVVPQRLPSTEHAAHYHSLRVHFQVVRWTVLRNDMIQANEWGWKMANNSLCPVMTDLDAAPAKVLKFIRCMCKSTGKNPCGTKQCSCPKNGMRCLMASNACRGQSRNNMDMTMNLDDADDDHHHDEDVEGNLDVWKGHQMTAVTWYVTFEYMLHMLSCYRTFKLLKRYVCTYAPRLGISLKKIPRPSNLHTTYLSRYSMRWYSQTKYFPNRSIFFSNLQTFK